MRSLWNWAWEKIPGSSSGSKWRNLFSYGAIALIALLTLEAIFAQFGVPVLTDAIVGPTLIFLVVLYFIVVVVGVIFLTSHQFRPAPLRLVRDTLISIGFTILAFSVFYRNTGITLSGDCPEMTTPTDAIYFSAVTFSTLGYGDFRPCPTSLSRLTAAFQAIFGNLHLGLIVGAAFFFAQGNGESEDDGAQHDHQSTNGRKG